MTGILLKGYKKRNITNIVTFSIFELVSRTEQINLSLFLEKSKKLFVTFKEIISPKFRK